jgi:hypothetical protein
MIPEGPPPFTAVTTAVVDVAQIGFHYWKEPQGNLSSNVSLSLFSFSISIGHLVLQNA